MPPNIKTSAPPIRLPICAKAIISIRFDADSTATLPVPPILLSLIPAAIADSTGYSPNNLPIKALAIPMTTTLVKVKITNFQVKDCAKTCKLISAKPIPANTACVKLPIITLLNITTDSSNCLGTQLNALNIITKIIIKA